MSVIGVLCRPTPKEKHRSIDFTRNKNGEEYKTIFSGASEINSKNTEKNEIMLMPGQLCNENIPYEIANWSIVPATSSNSQNVSQKQANTPYSISQSEEKRIKAAEVVNAKNKDDIQETNDKETENSRCQNRNGYCQLLQNFDFMRLFMIEVISGLAAYPVYYIIPLLVVEWGGSKFFASVCLSVSGATELVSYALNGYIIYRFNINKVKKSKSTFMMQELF